MLRRAQGTNTRSTTSSAASSMSSSAKNARRSLPIASRNDFTRQPRAVSPTLIHPPRLAAINHNQNTRTIVNHLMCDVPFVRQVHGSSTRFPQRNESHSATISRRDKRCIDIIHRPRLGTALVQYLPQCTPNMLCLYARIRCHANHSKKARLVSGPGIDDDTPAARYRLRIVLRQLPRRNRYLPRTGSTSPFDPLSANSRGALGCPSTGIIRILTSSAK